jgi:hypothetical protein
MVFICEHRCVLLKAVQRQYHLTGLIDQFLQFRGRLTEQVSSKKHQYMKQKRCCVWRGTIMKEGQLEESTSQGKS